MSMPSSSALVAASPVSSPERRARSMARRSSGRYPPRYAATWSRQGRVDLGEQVGGGQRDLLGPAARPDERQRADALDHQVGEQVGRLGGGGAAHGRAVLAGARGERRLPEGDGDLAARRGVVGDRHDVEAGEPAGVHLGLGDGGGGEHERRVGAVRRADPPQPAQHLGDVGAEHAAVVVALVDDDVLQRAEELRPPVVRGQQRAVQHVGVGQDVLGVVARPVALLARAVAVVGREPHVEPQRLQPGQLVLGERLGRGEVEDRRRRAGRAAPRAPRIAASGGQLVGQRLARRRAGRDDDVPSGVGGLGRLGLVAPRGAAGRGRRTPRARRRAPTSGQGAVDRRPRRQHLDVGQPVLAAGHRRRAGRPRGARTERTAIGADDRCAHVSSLPKGRGQRGSTPPGEVPSIRSGRDVPAPSRGLPTISTNARRRGLIGVRGFERHARAPVKRPGTPR